MLRVVLIAAGIWPVSGTVFRVLPAGGEDVPKKRGLLPNSKGNDYAEKIITIQYSGAGLESVGETVSRQVAASPV